MFSGTTVIVRQVSLRLITSVPALLYPRPKTPLLKSANEIATKTVVGLRSCDGMRQPHAALAARNVWDVETSAGSIPGLVRYRSVPEFCSILNTYVVSVIFI